MREILLLTAGLALLSASAFASDTQNQEDDASQAIPNATRSAAFVARDVYRHPVEELTFLGLNQDMRVVEIWPGKGYWTEILAPFFREKGTYYVALPPSEPNTAITRLLSSQPVYSHVKVTQFGPNPGDLSSLDPVDAIVTFRNLHNWLATGTADVALKDFYNALKPGGLLGIEDHRGLDTVPQDSQTRSGYVQEQFAIDLAKKAGFEFVDSSPINDNPKDTKLWPKGVWTLPPTLAMGDTDRAKYEQVGEADNFVLLFRKPIN